jgi:carboxymethylenebutenolidase
MGRNLALTASDGHRPSAYLADPAGEPRGAVVVIQEIFGVTRHIRAVADQYAAEGYLAVAPALFDRQERDVDVPYTDSQRGLGYMKAADPADVMQDLDAAIRHVSGAGKVATVGYCWGGLQSWLAAARLKVAAAIAYYGGGIDRHLADKPRAPVLFHFGERDDHISLAAVEKIRAAYPQGTYYLYPAGHGFNCTDRASFEADSAKLAFARSVEFLRQHVG